MADSQRQAIFARLKGKDGLFMSETFGLFLADKTGLEPPFAIEDVFHLYFDVTSCAKIEDKRLVKLMSDYETWKQNN